MSVRLLLALGTIILPLKASAEVFNHYIASSSMYPTLMPGDLIGASSYTENETIALGDFITYHAKSDGDVVPYIRRVIGLPGDRVRVNSGIVYINDAPLRIRATQWAPAYHLPEKLN